MSTPEIVNINNTLNIISVVIVLLIVIVYQMYNKKEKMDNPAGIRFQSLTDRYVEAPVFWPVGDELKTRETINSKWAELNKYGTSDRSAGYDDPALRGSAEEAARMEHSRNEMNKLMTRGEYKQTQGGAYVNRKEGFKDHELLNY
jgi:hypothetical protein